MNTTVEVGHDPIVLYVPGDTTAVAVDADLVVAAIAAQAGMRGRAVRVVRTGSRGMAWLEPLVEVGTASGRIAYGPVSHADVRSLFEAGWLEGGAHPLRRGAIDTLPVLQGQPRVLLARCGEHDPLSPAACGGPAWRAAAALPPASVATALVETGVFEAPGVPARADAGPARARPSVANVDTVRCTVGAVEGGFADRLLAESDPHRVIEGLAIVARALGAEKVVIAVDPACRPAAERLGRALVAAREAGVGVASPPVGIVVEVEPGPSGADAERLRVIDVPTAAAAAACFDARTGRLPPGPAVGSTRLVELAGQVRRPGVYELPAGLSLRSVVFDIAGGPPGDRPVKAIQVGGPYGACLPPSQWDLAFDTAVPAGAGVSGLRVGIVVHDDTVDIAGLARFALARRAAATRGCEPCRQATLRALEAIDRLLARDAVPQHWRQLQDLSASMQLEGPCGCPPPRALQSAIEHFAREFDPPGAAGT